MRWIWDQHSLGHTVLWTVPNGDNLQLVDFPHGTVSLPQSTYELEDSKNGRQIHVTS